MGTEEVNTLSTAVNDMAANLEISTVYQEITLCPNLSVAENMFIGRTKGIKQNWKKMNADTERILQSLDIPAKATQQLSTCSIAIQQMIAIARAVDMDCKVLILDEPTSSLDENEVAKLFGLMRNLKAKGVGIIFVTHFLDQVYEVCDKITVLRDGKLVGEYEIKDLPRVQLVSQMLGKDLDDMADIKGEQEENLIRETDTPVIETVGLSSVAGIGGYVYFLHVGSGAASHASGAEMNAIASSIIGGTMLTGGVGNIIGTFFGVLSLSTIQNIVSSAGLDEAWWTGITNASMLCIFLIVQSIVIARKKKQKK